MTPRNLGIALISSLLIVSAALAEVRSPWITIDRTFGGSSRER